MDLRALRRQLQARTGKDVHVNVPLSAPDRRLAWRSEHDVDVAVRGLNVQPPDGSPDVDDPTRGVYRGVPDFDRSGGDVAVARFELHRVSTQAAEVDVTVGK